MRTITRIKNITISQFVREKSTESSRFEIEQHFPFAIFPQRGFSFLVTNSFECQQERFVKLHLMAAQETTKGNIYMLLFKCRRVAFAFNALYLQCILWIHVSSFFLTFLALQRHLLLSLNGVHITNAALFLFRFPFFCSLGLLTSARLLQPKKDP